MKRVGAYAQAVGLLLLMCLYGPLPKQTLKATPVTEPDFIISHFKITASNGQFFEIYNNTDSTADMATVQLAYYNSFDLTKATSSKQISLSGLLPAKSYLLVNDSALTMCYQMMVASQSLGFSSTAGMVQLLKLTQSGPGSPVTTQLVDYVAWSKSLVAGAQTLPANTNAFLQRRWVDGAAKNSGGGSWLPVQPSKADPCVLESISTIAPAVQHDSTALLPATMPPVRFVTIYAPGEEAPVNRNQGLMAPVINEVLPNPASPQTDADDEFVELYNPNDKPFDLTDFYLAFGSTTPRKYNFVEGTILPPQSFMAFNSAETSLSLNNEKAQVWLLDSKENIISQTEPYADAKEGQSWALADGVWVWSLQPTPGAENIIASAGQAANQQSGEVLSMSTTAPSSSIAAGNAAANKTTPTEASTQDDATPVHPLVLAGVGTSAVGYAVYEYRHDMANRLFQFRRYLRNRRALR